MEERLENINRRLDRIEEILPTLTTKADLREAFEDSNRRCREFYEDMIDRLKRLGEGGGKRKR
jgi:hypothetical protein